MRRSGAVAARAGELANKPAEVPRDARGRVLPGATPNPSGRPKVWREFQEAMRERSPQAVAIVDRALRSRDAEERRWAAEKVLAYAWGRPPQRVQVGADEDAPPLPGERRFDLGALSAEDRLRLLELLDVIDGTAERPH
jgi:hypothetical protein